jgi:hypothetical protein
VVKVLLRPIARGPFKLAQMKLKGKYWPKNANNNARIWQHIVPITTIKCKMIVYIKEGVMEKKLMLPQWLKNVGHRISFKP